MINVYCKKIITQAVELKFNLKDCPIVLCLRVASGKDKAPDQVSTKHATSFFGQYKGMLVS